MNNSPKITEASKATLVEKPKAQFELTESMDAQAVVKKLDETHAPSKYHEAIQAYVKQVMGDKEAPVQNALTSESTNNYTKLYEQAVNDFYRSTEALDKKHEALLDEVTERTKTSLKTLKNMLEAEKAIAKSAPETLDDIKDYVDALADRYLNPDRAAALDEYKDKAAIFREGLQDQTAARVAWMKERGLTEKTNVNELKKYIDEQFQTYAGTDQFIDLNDLNNLDRRAKQYVDLVKTIQTDKNIDATLTKILEAKELLQPEDWERAIHDLTAMVIKSAVEYGAEKNLIAYAKTKTNQEMTFKEASEWLIDHTTSLAKQFPAKTIKETVKELQDINKAIHGDRLAYFNSVKESIRNFVYLEREAFLSGSNPLERASNKAVVEFMRKDRKGRDVILKNDKERAALFAGIKDITTNYPRMVKPGNIPNKREELTTAYRQGRSTEHDRMAQTMALISFAKEAEWLISQTEYAELLKATSVKSYKEGEIKMDYRTKPKRSKEGYQTMASQGGFNGTELGLSALKVAAGFVVLANVLNARDKSKGPIGAFFSESFVKGVVENPAVWAGVGTIYGVNKYRENKEVGDILFKDPYGRERLGVHLSVNGINKRLTKENISTAALTGFMTNTAEFELMEKLQPSKVASLLQKAAKKKESGEPVITRESLKEIAGPELLAKLGTGVSDRVRYLFYEKFLNQKRHIGDLKDHCLTWKPNQA